jgi:hypothetical protein
MARQNPLRIFEEFWQGKFKAAVSEHLKASGKRAWQSKTLSGAEVMQIYLGKIEGQSLVKLTDSPDLIILDLFGDGKNKSYNEVLYYLVSTRTQWQRPTIINSRYPISSKKFISIYGSDFSTFLIENRDASSKPPASFDVSDFRIEGED